MSSRYRRIKNDFDIHLFKFSIQNYRKNENDFIIYKFDYRGESFVEIDFFSLFEIINHLMSFMLYDFVNKVFFNFTNSFVFQNTRI